MTINLKCKSILVVALLNSVSNFAASSTVASNNSAPTASALEAKIKHWNVPESDQSFRDIPELDKAYFDITPTDTGDGIPVGKLGTDGGNKEIILNLAKEIGEGKHGNYDSLLISEKGKLLFESYYKRGRVDLSHPQSSATKSYTSLALGRAIQMGYLSMADLDKPLITFLKDIDPSKLVEGAEKITLHNALTMTTGILIEEDNWDKLNKDANRVKGQGEVQAILEDSAPISEETQVFRYGIGPQFVMQVIDAVVPGTAKDFIQVELLNKMGITNYDWQTALSGLPEAGWKVSMTSRDMLKLGILTINKGKWQGKQLISEAYINKATSRLLLPGDDDIFGGGKDVSKQGYGYYWWSADLRHRDKSYYTISAQGGGGMYIILIPELDLVVVVTAHHRDNTTLQLVAEHIIPAFIR